VGIFMLGRGSCVSVQCIIIIIIMWGRWSVVLVVPMLCVENFSPGCGRYSVEGTGHSDYSVLEVLIEPSFC
jgi:hypothetical protein